MLQAGFVPFLRSTAKISLAVMLAFGLFYPLQARAQKTTPSPRTPQNNNPQNNTPNRAIPIQPTDPTDPADPNNNNNDVTEPTNVRPIAPESTILSVQGGQRLMAEAAIAISDQNYTVAAQKLQEARQIFNQLSNFYQQLAGSFSGVDSRLFDSNRNKALETAQMRDEATYQLALVHRSQNKPELAVPLLVQIIRSQQPTRELGKKAYQQLLELGFVDTPYPRPSRDGDKPTPSKESPSTPSKDKDTPPTSSNKPK
jgi:hypothetical protein